MLFINLFAHLCDTKCPLIYAVYVIWWMHVHTRLHLYRGSQHFGVVWLGERTLANVRADRRNSRALGMPRMEGGGGEGERTVCGCGMLNIVSDGRMAFVCIEHNIIQNIYPAARARVRMTRREHTEHTKPTPLPTRPHTHITYVCITILVARWWTATARLRRGRQRAAATSRQGLSCPLFTIYTCADGEGGGQILRSAMDGEDDTRSTVFVKPNYKHIYLRCLVCPLVCGA